MRVRAEAERAEPVAARRDHDPGVGVGERARDQRAPALHPGRHRRRHDVREAGRPVQLQVLRQGAEPGLVHPAQRQRRGRLLQRLRADLHRAGRSRSPARRSGGRRRSPSRSSTCAPAPARRRLRPRRRRRARPAMSRAPAPSCRPTAGSSSSAPTRHRGKGTGRFSQRSAKSIRPLFRGSAGVVAPGLASPAQSARQPAPILTLWYRQPAATWVEALPVGNGRLGAMVFGGVAEERLQLNEITLWSGGPQDADNPEALVGAAEDSRAARSPASTARRRRSPTAPSIAKGQGSGHGRGANAAYGSYQTLGDLQAHVRRPRGAPATIAASSISTTASPASATALGGATLQPRGVRQPSRRRAVVARVACDRPGLIDVAVGAVASRAGGDRGDRPPVELGHARPADERPRRGPA